MVTPSSTHSSASVLRRVGRIFLKVLIGILAFFILLIILIQTPPVQNFARKKVVAFLEKKLQTRVSIGKINIGIPNKVLLENIYLEDRQKDTLLSGGRISANLDMFKLISSDIQINQLEIEEVTAKIQRVLPDTVFNFQFIVDAFTPKNVNPANPADTAALKMALDKVLLNNIRLVYNDLITGNDMDIRLDHFETNIETFDPVKQVYKIPLAQIKGLRATIYQHKPMVVPDPVSKDMAEAAAPIPIDIDFNEVSLEKIKLNYRNDVSAFYTNLDLGKLIIHAEDIDLQNYLIRLDELQLNETNAAIRLGKKETAKVIAKEVKQEVQSQAQNNWRFEVGKLSLNNNNIQFDNDNMPRQSHGMDYAHLNAQHLTLHANNFLFTVDSIGAEITKGSLKEQSGFELTTLETKFMYAAKGASLENLLLETPGTTLRRSVAIKYPSIEVLQKNIGVMQMDIDLDNSKIQTKDILTFAPQLRSQPIFKNSSAVWHINSRITGAVGRMQIHELQFRGFQNTRADIKGTIAGLPDANRLNTSLVINTLSTTKTDIEALLPKGTLPPNITLPDRLDLRGTIAGNTASMRTDLDLNTNLGNASIDGTIGNFTTPASLQYNTVISMRHLNLGRILQNEQSFGTISANFTAIGKGIDPKTANASVKGVIQSAVINKYNYRDVELNGTIARQQLKASLNISDPNVDLTMNAESDLSAKFPSVQLTANIDSIKTLPLHLTTEPVFYHGTITGNFPVTDPANLTGELFITQSILATNDVRIQLDSVQLIAGKTDSGQFIRMNSDVVNMHLYGRYNLVQLGAVLQQSIQPYFALVPSYKTVPTDPYDFKITASVVNSPALKVFLPDLKRLDPLLINGHFSTSNGWQMNINTPMIVYGVNTIQKFNLDAGTVNGAIDLKTSIESFRSGTAAHVYGTSVNATVANNKINYQLNIKDKAAKDKYNVAGTFNQSAQQGNYSLSLTPGQLLLNYEQWVVSNGNAIQFGSSGILVNNFVLSKNNEQLSINSQPATPNAPLAINFANFKLGTITGFAQQDSLIVDGVLNGNIQLANLAAEPTFTADLTVNELSLYKDTLGNARIQLNNTRQNIYAANINLTGRGNDISIVGDYYQPPNGNESFSLNMDIRQLQLNTIEGATAGAISNASGTLDGKFSIRGNFEKPLVNGNLRFNKTGFNITMLNSHFTVDQENIEINQAGVLFDSFTVRDSSNNALVLDGYAYTTDFANYRFDLNVDATNFRAISSTKRNNALYYGQLYFDSDLHITGTGTSPVVDGAIKINESTDFTVVIPQQQPGVIERDGIVRFVDMDSVKLDTAIFAAYDSLNSSDVKGIEVSVNIEVDRKATFSLVIDEANGDFVRMKGEAQLTGGIDKSGKVTLAGSYEIDEGSYEISFNLLRRKFDILKGSKIVWLGEPTRADVDVTAVYIANTAPLSLVEHYITDNPNYYKQKIPFEVHLVLKGQLLRPEITFDITLPKNKNYIVGGMVNETVEARLAQLRQEPSQMSKQVFAVLLMNRFISENPFASSGGAGGINAGAMARQSLSKILAEQLNDLAGDLIKGVEINFDVSSYEDYSSGNEKSSNRTDLNVSLSKQLLNDRLRVTVGNNFELEGSQAGGGAANGIAGNIALDYQLSRDGRYMIRAYRKNDYEGTLEGYVVETGVTFIITLDYTHFRELFRKKKKQQEKKPEAPVNNEPKETLPVPDAKLMDE